MSKFDKNAILHDEHWLREDYAQRMSTGMWRKFLLAGEDMIICRGLLRRLVIKKLGFGVVEVSKESLGE